MPLFNNKWSQTGNTITSKNSSDVITTGALRVGTGSFVAGVGRIYITATQGLLITAGTGSVYDLLLTDRAGNAVLRLAPGSPLVEFNTAGDTLISGNNGALATTAVTGFLYIPRMAGVPTGVPTNAAYPYTPTVHDTTNNRIYFYNGAWVGTERSLAGVYSPTRSAEANILGSVSMTEAQYMRVGNTVTVSGRFTADPVLTATATSFEIDLPVASNLGAAEDAAGVAFCGSIAGMGAEVIGSAANNTAKIQWLASDINSQTWSYTFTYQII